LIVDKAGKLQPVEIKSGQTLNSDFFNGLKRWGTLAQSTSIHPTLVYGGDDSLVRHQIHVCSWRNPAWLNPKSP